MTSFSKINSRSGVVLATILILVISFLTIRDVYHYKYYGTTTKAKVFLIYSVNRKGVEKYKNMKYSFFVEGEEYFGTDGLLKNLHVGGCVEIEYSSVNPKINRPLNICKRTF